jgi:phage baseplate assembly protein W
VSSPSILGFGLLRPLRRDQASDFAAAGGIDLVKADVGQLLGTRAQTDTTDGELQWRTESGSRLHRLRHLPNDEILAELARADVDAAFAQDNRVRLTEVTTERKSQPPLRENVLVVRIRYDIVLQSPGGFEVVAQGIEQEITVA